MDAGTIIITPTPLKHLPTRAHQPSAEHPASPLLRPVSIRFILGIQREARAKMKKQPFEIMFL